MYCVYKNILSDNRKLYLSFFLNFNHFNCFFFLKEKNLSNINSWNLKKNNFNFFFKGFKSNLLLLKFYKYFNNLIFFKNSLIQKNYLNFYGKFNKFNVYVLNNYSFFHYKKVINLIYQINLESKNFVLLDKSYKNIFPLYNYIFNHKTLFSYKNYFFLNSKFFTRNNWIYFYNIFAIKFKVVFIIILDLNLFSKFFKSIQKINLPMSSLLPANTINAYIDYPVYVNFNYFFEKFTYMNLISQITLIALNYKNYKYKLKYITLFYKFSLNMV